MRTRMPLSLIAIGLVLVTVAAACSPITTGPVPAATAPPGAKVGPELPAASGAALLQSRCTECHSVSRIARTKATRAEWDTIVGIMIDNGAQLTDAERSVLVDYLAQTYHP